MLNKRSLVGLACAIGVCAIGFTAPAFGQGGQYSLGGAIGGRAILGASVYQNAPLSALWIDRQAHVFGNYRNAIAKFDRVIQPDGSVMVMRRISDPHGDPSKFSYLPTSWPGVGAMGRERVMDASGNIVAERNVIISQYQIMAAGIPIDGPRIATLDFERTVMPDGTSFVTASAENPDPGVALALSGSPIGVRYGMLYHGPTVASR